MNSSDYLQKRNGIISYISKALNNAKDSEKILLNIKDSVNDALERKQEEKTNLSKTYELAIALPQADQYTPSLLDEDLLVTGYNMAYAVASHSDFEYGLIYDASNSFVTIQGSSMISAFATYPTRTVIHTIAENISNEYTPLREVLHNIAIPDQFEKRNKIKTWLDEIDQLIAQKFKESFDDFNDKKYMSAAHAMRDALSSLWQKLSPDDEILKAPWYKEEESNKGKPSQKQRIMYSIIGNSLQLSDEDIKLIENLANEGRDIYNKLSSEAHRREGNYEENMIKINLSIGESIIEQIMNLRKKFIRIA